MVRKMVGWIWHPGDEWEIFMHNMKIKVQNDMRQYFVKPWDERIHNMRVKYFSRLAGMGDERWEKLSLDWEPKKVNDFSPDYVAHRFPGRGITNTIVGGIRDYLFWRSFSQLSPVLISYKKLIAVATQN